MKASLFALGSAVIITVSGCCSPRSHLLEPAISYEPQPRQAAHSPSAFAPLTEEELAQSWGQELYLADSFAHDFDLYRAITCYKRALLLLPKKNLERLQQIEYSIFLSYYLGRRYGEAISTFEDSKALSSVSGAFPPIRQLLSALYESYLKSHLYEKAEKLLLFIEKVDQGMADSLILQDYLQEGCVDQAYEAAADHPRGEIVIEALDQFRFNALSVSKAQWLNAALPGAGYFYVGQRSAAATSFVINSLFTAAAYQFFHRGYWAAGAVTASLEMGWYLGGINGAGLAAKQYNEALYNGGIKEAMISARLFPVLCFETMF